MRELRLGKFEQLAQYVLDRMWLGQSKELFQLLGFMGVSIVGGQEVRKGVWI